MKAKKKKALRETRLIALWFLILIPVAAVTGIFWGIRPEYNPWFIRIFIHLMIGFVGSFVFYWWCWGIYTIFKWVRGE